VRELEHRVQEGEAGRTVASLLHDLCGVSHRNARGIVEAGLLRVDGRTLGDPVTRVEAGQVLTARFDPARRYAARPRARRTPETRWFRVIHQDAEILVVDKAPGLPTVPVGPARGDSLVERLLATQPPAARDRGLRVVHRIDRYASGLVVLARRGAALSALREQFAAREPLREYLALVAGRPPGGEGTLRGWLVEDPHTRKMVPAAEGEGKEAVLTYRTVENLRHGTLLRVRLETGRRNQIRVQMAAAGCPLVGDRAYGRPSPLIGRVALHAAGLCFRHPGSGRRVEFRTDPPRDFAGALERMRGGAIPARRGRRPRAGRP
jgi:23S rRNA pseudouridine1911/1915/1917 synthase